MPRLTTHDYLAIHTVLRRYWLHAKMLYGELPAREQWYLHDYFRPSEDLDDLTLLTHRREVSTQHPALPQCAGRAWLHFRHAADKIYRLSQQPAAVPPTRRPRRPRPSRRHVSVKAVVHPTIDVHRYAMAIVKLAMQMAEQEAKRDRGDDHPAA